ncbi:MAG: helix-turn-helix domain-containing protein [Clostridia bacterium]|nr:helix-turn-helix domain-containing protein [Clostridia bacterium]
MENTQTYVISQLAMITGLSDRTLRNYIANGVLQGEKINGMWRFTPEQVEAFVVHPEVRQSILIKNKSLVYDFLLDEYKKEDEACLILDLPGADQETIMETIALKINGGTYKNIHFSFDGNGKIPRVILKGRMNDVLELANAYRNAVSEK